MKRILAANRGEIAVRILRSAQEAGYSAAAVHSDQDLGALHVRTADVAAALPGATAAETYLNIDAIIRAAGQLSADAVHPGYGFLSENPDFARAVQEAGLTWIGPAPHTIEKLGNKVTARQIAVAAGAPLVPGTDGPVDSSEAVHAFAEDHGFPIVIKAAHGGGGRGMRVVRESSAVDDAYASAVREAEGAFGRGECFVERFLDRPRHVEAQVLADAHGTVVVAGTRDCSLQRRNQKLVEEAPAPFLTDDQRRRIHQSARAICAEAGYLGAGTVEYLLSPDGLLSFLEVNTRLQVEHPVTEETSGLDLVAEQFRIAEGQPLSVDQDPDALGHAIEFRLTAEEPALGFLPAPGPVDLFGPPTGPGIRVDTGVLSGDEVDGAFDSMFAKLIVSGPDRPTTLLRARHALEQMRIDGVPTVLPFHRAVVDSPDFRAEPFEVHTGWIESEFASELAESQHLASALRHRQQGIRRMTLEFDGRPVEVGLPSALGRLLGGASFEEGASVECTSGADDAGVVTSPVTGTLVRWGAQDGAPVDEGEAVAVVEAMKMESTVTAPVSGLFTHGEVEPGASISTGQVLGHVG